MNYGWPNLGHDSIVTSLAGIAAELAPLLVAAGLKVRVLSFDVRPHRARFTSPMETPE